MLLTKFPFHPHPRISPIRLDNATIPHNVSSRRFLPSVNQRQRKKTCWGSSEIPSQFEFIELFTASAMSGEKLCEIIVYFAMRSLRPHLDIGNQSVGPSILFHLFASLLPYASRFFSFRIFRVSIRRRISSIIGVCRRDHSRDYYRCTFCDSPEDKAHPQDCLSVDCI